MDKKLFALIQEQAAKREKMKTFAAMELDELNRIVALAAQVFGKGNTKQRNGTWGGVVEAGPEEPGIVYVGYYIDPPNLPAQRRRRQLLFRGAKFSEIKAQIKLWMETQGHAVS